LFFFISVGQGSFGVLGLGDENDVWEPTAIKQLSGQILPHVALGSTHMLAVNQQGELLSWGHNESV
jgi:alpha-tubulin suppressor-like RCC1 family protein